jgi:hypothetical protein
MNNYKNIETWNCKLDFFQDAELDQIIPDLDDYNGKSERLIEETALAMKDMVEESIAFSCGYHTSGDAYNWAMMGVNRVDFYTLAKEIVDEYYS